MTPRQLPGRRILPVAVVMIMFFVTGSWAASQEKILHNFTGGIDGEHPIWSGNLIFDGKGNLYGTTLGGGSFKGVCNVGGCGTVFKLSLFHGAWKKKTIYEFAGGSGDGAYPNSGLVFDPAGNLYGTTQVASPGSCGGVFKLSPTSGGGWTAAVLYQFTGVGSGGCTPSGVTLDNAGNIYGTTFYGGAYTYGTVFELTMSGHVGAWTESTLHNFNYDGNDGVFPFASLSLDEAGNLYGTTTEGGTQTFGTVFEMINSGGVWEEKVIYNFEYYNGNKDGAYPYSAVTFDKTGNLYGTTTGGGTGTACPPGSCGTVYRLKRSHGGWTESVLYSFQGNKDGSLPVAGVALRNGKLYGTTEEGGDVNSSNCNPPQGCGTIFTLKQSGGKWVKTAFQLKGSNGALPQAGVVVDAKGVLYGTTLYGGGGSCTNNMPGCGVVFALVP